MSVSNGGSVLLSRIPDTWDGTKSGKWPKSSPKSLLMVGARGAGATGIDRRLAGFSSHEEGASVGNIGWGRIRRRNRA